MATHKQALLAELKAEVGSLGADLRQMAALRWQLARLELEADARAVSRLARVWILSAVMALCALSLLAVCAADVLDGRLGIARWGWLLILGLGLLSGGAAASYRAWRLFRASATGMEQSLAELREDLVWLKEWIGEKAEGGGENDEGRSPNDEAMTKSE